MISRLTPLPFNAFIKRGMRSLTLDHGRDGAAPVLEYNTARGVRVLTARVSLSIFRRNRGPGRIVPASAHAFLTIKTAAKSQCTPHVGTTTTFTKPYPSIRRQREKESTGASK